MRTGPGRAVHGDLPDEQPGGGELGPRWRTGSTTWPGWAGGPATAQALFGYTDQGVDPATVADPADPRLENYEGVLPGFDPVESLDSRFTGWLAWLESLGYDDLDPVAALNTEPDRPAGHSASAYLTDRAIDWMDRQDDPWFAHVSYWRPHPPYAVAGTWSTAYRPGDVGLPIPVADDIHPLHRMALGIPFCSAPEDPGELARIRAQYFGMVSEVDEQLGRLVDHLRVTGRLDDTVVVVTSDHGEQLGDHGLVEKLGYFDESYHVLCLVRHPDHPGSAGRVVTEYTEAVDVLPTLAEVVGLDAPLQCDGRSLVPFLEGGSPEVWRQSAHYEFDWRNFLIGPHRESGGADPSLEQCNLAVERTPHPRVRPIRVTGRGSASTSPPIPAGTRRPPIRRWCYPWPSPCCAGGPPISAGSTPRCCSPRTAGAGGRTCTRPENPGAGRGDAVHVPVTRWAFPSSA